MSEVWKDIKGYEGLYKISNHGNVYSIRNKMFLKIQYDYKGYARVNLCIAGRKKYARVHRLVADAFIPNPHNLPQVNHKDENKANNYVDNLEWCTNRYNNSYGTARERAGISNQKSVSQFSLDGKFIKDWDSIASVSNEGFNISCVSQCVNGNVSTHNGYIWVENTKNKHDEVLKKIKYINRFRGGTQVIKKVEQYDFDGNLINIYDNIKRASENGFNHGAISQCCNGKSKTHKGFIWKFIE